jgi:hypothetical protein
VVVRENKKKPCPENEAGRDVLFLAETATVESRSFIGFQVLAPEVEAKACVGMGSIFPFRDDA